MNGASPGQDGNDAGRTGVCRHILEFVRLPDASYIPNPLLPHVLFAMPISKGDTNVFPSIGWEVEAIPCIRPYRMDATVVGCGAAVSVAPDRGKSVPVHVASCR